MHRSITQGETETVQDFVIHLQTAVPDCEFSCPSCDFDLSENNVRDQFIRGLSNTLIQTDILTKASQLTSLEQVTNHAKSIEAALRDQSSFDKAKEDHVYGANHRKSSLKKKVRFNNDNSYQQQKSRFKPNVCIGCGSNTHRNNERDQKCPAWGKICGKCGKDNHFSHACLSDNSHMGAVDMIGHVRYDTSSQKYTTASSNVDQISATLTPKLQHKTLPSVTTDIFPDSGASICLGGTEHLEILEIPKKDLIPCNKSIGAVGGSKLICSGWLPMEFSVSGHLTTQPLYFCDNVVWIGSTLAKQHA